MSVFLRVLYSSKNSFSAMASSTVHALMNHTSYLQSKAFAWTSAHLFLLIENVYFTPHILHNIFYTELIIFLNVLLQLNLPVIIFWVNRITKNLIIQARNWKTIFFSILHCLTAHGLTLSFNFVSGTLPLISFHLSPWKDIITGELVLLLPV